MRRIFLLFAFWLPLVAAACGSPAARTPALSTPASAAPSSSAAPAAPAASPDDPQGALPPFQCQGDASGSSATASAVTAVRAATHPGFDRFVVQFDGPVAGYQVVRRASASFVQDGRGNTVSLRGSAGLLVRLAPSSSYAYGGPTDLATGFQALLEARQTGSFEGVTQWGLGLAQPACMRVFSLANPSRLVVDIQH